jgi:hypothetical protein
LYLAPGHIPATLASELNFLTDEIVKSDLTSVPNFFVLKFYWWIRGCPPVMVFPQHDVVFILYL